MDESPEQLSSISRRKVIGLGIATGVAIAAAPTTIAIAKAPWKPDEGPELHAAFDFAIKKSFKSGPGFYAVSWSEDNFTGDPFLIGTPAPIPKRQTGTMPPGWGSKTGSIVVGPGAVLRLIHKVNGQEKQITLLPHESLAQISALAIIDDQLSWKLYPINDLRPPY